MAIVWSGVSAATCGVTDHRGLFAVRYAPPRWSIMAVLLILLPGSSLALSRHPYFLEQSMSCPAGTLGERWLLDVPSCIPVRRLHSASLVSLLPVSHSLGTPSRKTSLTGLAVFSTLEGRNGLAGWQWLFIVLALTGAGLAMIALFVLPDYPHSKTGSARWSMTQDMRIVAAARIAADRVSTSEAKAGVLQGLKMSVFDYKMWMLVALNIGL